MNFIFSEVWWMNTIIAAIITGMFTLICSYIAYSYKIRKGLDTIERMEHTQESRQKELSGQHEKMSEKLSQEHQQISRDIRPYADKIVRIDSHMTDLVQRANQQDSLYHSLSREQQKMSDFIQHGIDGYHAVQAELLRLSAENQSLKQAVQEKGQQPENILNYAYVSFGACVKDGVIDTDLFYADASMSDFEDLWQIFVFSIEDYNRIMNLQQTLSDGQVLMYTTKQEYSQSTLTIGDMAPLAVQQASEGFIGNSIDAMQIFPSMFLFVSDFDSMAQTLTSLPGANGENLAELEWFYGFDLSCDSQEQIEIYQSVENVLQQSGYPDQQTLSYVRCDSAAQDRDYFFGLHGGFFFLGILLGIVFVFAAVLIMYYKQVSEGYEDQSRFDIMQKVGMTKREIRRSVNSQVLTVFFLPLITAGVHLAFAFPMVYKLLMLFGLVNLKLLILVTVICYLIFALFYMLVYRITSGAYYSIASAGEIRCS